MKRFFPVLCAILIAANAAAQTQPGSTSTQNTHEIDVPGSSLWTDTGVDLKTGQSVTITATGNLQFSDGASPDAAGAARGWKDLLRSMPVNSAGRGALIGRIGSDDAAEPFLVGTKGQFTVRVPGRLFLGYNSISNETAQGGFHATIEISGEGTSNPPTSSSGAAGNSSSSGSSAPQTSGLSGSSGTASSKASPANSGSSSASSPAPAMPPNPAAADSLPKNLFAKIPRRISDKDGNAGDMINFVLIGSEEQVKAAFQAAGWVQVDRDVTDAIVEGLIASLSKQVYLTMPMSQLYLYGRPQDFGFAHAEPLKVVTTRHHLRIWKSTLAVAGQPVWVGAATHDMGIERDQRNSKLTHHIDPNVDDERGFVTRSLTESGYVSQYTSVLPPNPLLDARTATGGSFHSDGEVVVFWLASN